MALAASLAQGLSAYPTVQKHKPVKKMSLRQVERYQLRLISLDRWIIRTQKVHKPAVVWFSRHRIRWTMRELGETKAKLAKFHRSVSSGVGGIAHRAGWLCIHSREGSWSDDGAPYYGGLQMSEGWMGVVYHANLLSPTAQMALAERVAAQHGFADWWMRGQWPRTYPPCAGYF